MIPEFTAKKTSNKKTTLKTVQPQLADINYASNLDIIKEFSTYVENIKNIEDQINISLAYYNNIQDCDPVTKLTEFYLDLNDNKFEQIDNEFIEFWSKRFYSSIEPIKQKVLEKIGKKKNFYTSVSDSIGLLVNTENKLDDSTTPTYDIYCNIYGAPNYIPVQLRNKISEITANISNELSSKTTSRIRTNLRNIYYVSPNTPPYVDSTVSHGLNLVSDYKFFIDYTNILARLFVSLMDYYNKLFTFIEYYSNIKNDIACNLRDLDKSNAQKVDNFYFDINVENVTQNVDFLLNKLQLVLSDKTIKNTLSNPKTRNTYAYNRSTNQLNLNPSVSKTSIPSPTSLELPKFDFNIDFTNYLNQPNQLLNSTIGQANQYLNLPNQFFNTAIGDVNQFLNFPTQFAGNVFQNTPLQSLNLNTIIPELSLPSVPNFLPSLDPSLLNQFTGFATSNQFLPGFGLGSFGELAGLAASFNGGLPSDPMAIFNSIEQLKTTLCNFQLPTFTAPNFDFPANFFDSFFKILNIFPKFGIDSFDLSKVLENAADNFVDNITKTFEDLYKNLFTC